MTIKEIYNKAIALGVAADFRNSEEIGRYLKEAKDDYEKIPQQADKELFDKERLSNPYSDTRILFGEPNGKVKKILAGIDINGEELLLADKMSDIGLIISHHPRGIALAGLDDAMRLQSDVLHYYGVPINIAEKLLSKKIGEVGRNLSGGNHNRVVDMAKILGLALMTVHTPADNLVANFLKNKLAARSKFYYVGDIISVLKKIPEYREAAKIGIGPKIFVGSSKNRAGKIALTEITGGTEGSPEIYDKLAQAGIGTIIGMHISEKHKENAEKANVNVIIAGHMSSDSLGMNLFLDELQKQGTEIISCSGLIRIQRF